MILLCLTLAAAAQAYGNNPRILSIYHGLDPLPPRATRLCGLPPAANQDGMPVVFLSRLTGIQFLHPRLQLKSAAEK